MRRRLDLAMTLVGSPESDLPRRAHDRARPAQPPARCGTSIRELAAGGVTIFLTTQYLDEADQLADRIAVLDHGRIVAEGTPDELKRRIPGGHVRLQFADRRALSQPPAALLDGATRDEERARRSRCPATATSRRCVSCSSGSTTPDVEVEELSIHTPDLDDVFFAVTGHPTARRRSQSHDRASPTPSAIRPRCCAATCGACCATRR